MSPAVRFRRMLNIAKGRGLHESPPYADSRAQSAWLAGYECALSDVAKGKVPYA